MATIWALRTPLNEEEVLRRLGDGWGISHDHLGLKFEKHEIGVDMEAGLVAYYNITAGGRDLEHHMAKALDAISEYQDDDPDWTRLFGGGA